MNILLQIEAKAVKLRLNFFNSEVIANSKMNYSDVHFCNPFLIFLYVGLVIARDDFMDHSLKKILAQP